MNPEDLTPLDVLDAAIDRLHERGWIQGEQGFKDGPNCLTGAVYWGRWDLVGTRAIPKAMDVVNAALERQLRKKEGRYRRLTAWNDEPERTCEDVLLLLKETRYELEGKR